MDNKKRKVPEKILSSDPNFDDFGVWLAWRNGDIDDNGNKVKKASDSSNLHRDQAKRMIAAQKKKAAKK